MTQLNGKVAQVELHRRIHQAERERQALYVERAARLSRRARRLHAKAERSAHRARLILARAI